MPRMSIDAEGEHLAPRGLPGATVLQIVPALDDDHSGREVLDLTLALVRGGARAIVASPEGTLVPELQSFGGEWIAYAGARSRFWPMPRTSRHLLAELLATERIDIIHTRGVRAAKFAAKAIDPFATRLVFGCGEEALGHGRDRVFSRALLRADRVLAHSGYLADLLIEAHEIPRERAIVVPRRIDTARFDPSAVSIERIAALRQAWNVQRGERIILVPGAIDPANGQHVLIEAARMLVSGGLRHVVFVLAGDQSRQPAYALALTTSARAHGVGHLVRQVGICPDMPAAYAAADFVALPAIVPPTFGRAAAEALAMGRPVVASELGALPELVLAPPRAPQSARTGWLVAPADPVALAHGLAAAEALELAALSSVGAHARRLATLLLSPGQVTAAVWAVYAGLIEQSA